MPPHISYHLISPHITISPQTIPAHIIPPHTTSRHLILHHPTSLILYFTPLHHTRLHPITSHHIAAQCSALLTNPPIPVSIPPSLRTVWYFKLSDSPLLSLLSFLPLNLCLLSYLICIPPLTLPLLPSIPPITPPSHSSPPHSSFLPSLCAALQRYILHCSQQLDGGGLRGTHLQTVFPSSLQSACFMSLFSACFSA